MWTQTQRNKPIEKSHRVESMIFGCLSFLAYSIMNATIRSLAQAFNIISEHILISFGLVLINFALVIEVFISNYC
jgi:hypothetical protein